MRLARRHWRRTGEGSGVSWERALLIGLIAFLGGGHYVLAWYSIQDLIRRPSVRGGNKTLWGLFILILPIGGSVIYGIYGPTSFLTRHRAVHPRLASLEDEDFRAEWTRRRDDAPPGGGRSRNS